MSRTELLLLVGEIRQSRAVLENIWEMYTTYVSTFADEQKRDIRDAVMLAEILANTYTCVETILFRIARVFENHLDAREWHKELLRKMSVEVPGVRKAVLSQKTCLLLDELRRFRHFRRYYYHFDYDWARLDYLRTVYERLMPVIHQDLDDYVDFLLVLAEAKD